MTAPHKLKGFLVASLLGAVAACSLPQDDPAATTVDTNAETTAAAAKNSQMRADYISSVIDLARQLHVDPVKAGDEEKLTSSAINGALKEMDPHSTYLTPTEFKAMLDRASGEFAGVGVTIGIENNLPTISETMDGSPAEQAGLKAGDQVTHVDGISTAGMSLSDVTERIRGKAKTPVGLTISRQGQAPFTVNVIRDKIQMDVVTSKMIGNDIGYVQIKTFHNDNVDSQLNDAIQKLDRHNNVRGYVLDLRGNPGGYVHMANAVSDAFIDGQQDILSMRGRNPGDVKTYQATPGDVTGGKPIVVLVNEGSASASEIVAGALQDTGRATILGTQSYGKGSVQSIIQLNDGSALKITTARYYTAGGRSIQNHGITPDIAYVRNALDEVPQIKPESEQANTLANLDAAGTDKTETKADCTAVNPTPSTPVEKGLQTRSGKADFALACAVETLRNKPVLTVTTPRVAPAAAPAP